MVLSDKEQLDAVLSLINTKISLPKFKTEISNGKPFNSIIGSYELSLVGEKDLIQLRNLAMDLLTRVVPGISVEDLNVEKAPAPSLDEKKENLENKEVEKNTNE